MERVANSLRSRMVGVVLLIHVALVPLLYLGVATIVADGYADQFVNSVRAYSRVVADETEAIGAADFDTQAAALLDSVVLSGQVAYAVITDGDHRIGSSIAAAPSPKRRQDDFDFGDHGDQLYYISHPLARGGHSAVLRLGFDEGPTIERIAAARRRILMAMLAFAVVTIGLALWLSRVILRPIVRLREAAKRVAGGDVHTELQTSSSIREVQELNHHLERMRQELVGTNDRLASEMREREVSEGKRLDLERRLLHRERIATIGTLAGGVAHEFNNILTPILLYSQVAMSDAPPDSALAKDLTRIIAAAHRARSLITRILTFSREMDQPQTGVFSLRSTVEEALTLLRAIVPANIEIRFLTSTETLYVAGDPSLMHQVVINLCTNAYQAMRASGGMLILKLEAALASPECAAGDFVCLTVSDTGHGMEQGVMSHVFEPFFTTREVGEGTGLGLSVVHGIVTSMEGSITVDSVVSVGSTFSVYLPRAQSPVLAPLESPASVQAVDDPALRDRGVA